MLTPAQRKRLAKEARKLAMECVEGTAPEFDTGYEFHKDGTPCCAMGHLQDRCGIAPPPTVRFTGFSKDIPEGTYDLVAWANDFTYDHAERRAAVVFPLLALADALEEA